MHQLRAQPGNKVNFKSLMLINLLSTDFIIFTWDFHMIYKFLNDSFIFTWDYCPFYMGAHCPLGFIVEISLLAGSPLLRLCFHRRVYF